MDVPQFPKAHKKYCMDIGYPGLSSILLNTVTTILENNEIKSDKITYYLERKDPGFKSKMHEVLVVYKRGFLSFDADGSYYSDGLAQTVTVSYDERTGIHAL